MLTRCLQTKLSNVTSLTTAETSALEDTIVSVKDFRAGFDIIAEGSRPDVVHLMLDGWAARRKMLENGVNQFTAFLIPGDFCDIHINVLAKMDHHITSLTPCRMAMIDGEKLDRLTAQNSNLSRALWWSTLVDEAILRQWIVNNGQRKAFAATAHILCEMHVRLQMVGLPGDAKRFAFPLTQEHLAAATGLSPVHTNRVLQQLRKDGLIELRGKKLKILDMNRLREAAGFEIEYFHLQTRTKAGQEIEL